MRVSPPLNAVRLTCTPGILKIGTPICVPERDFIVLGRVVGIQVCASACPSVT
jgi:hypothetical protein